MKNIINRKAKYDYEFIEKYECGIMLTGTEVKSIRAGNMNISESFCLFKDNELYLHNAHISKYSQCDFQNHDELSDRKLLLTKKELRKLQKEVQVQGISIIPLQVYNNKTGILKIEIALCKGKKDYDKRESIKERDTKREIDRRLKIY